MDKLSILNHGTGIPKNIVNFWKIKNLKPNDKHYIKVIYEEDVFIMQIVSDHLQRYRLFWDGLFSKIIKEKFEDIYINQSEIELNPEKDLIPVCSNCHRMIHRKRHFVYTVEDIRGFIK